MHYLGEMETVIILCGKLFRTITTKFYQNRPDFVDDVSKTCGVFLGSQFQSLSSYKTQTLSFTR